MTMLNLQELTTTDNGSGQSEHGTWRDSILHLYLPEGLILNLVSEVFHTDPV
jgi:DnaJ family protein C protein 13